MKYNFGWARNKDIGVDIPQLDAFIADMSAAMKKHGVTFELEHDYDGGRSKVVLVPCKEPDVSFLTEDLEEYSHGIAWLDEAREEWKQRNLADAEKQKSEEMERGRAIRAAHDAKILREGVMVDGKKYKLVEG